MGIFGDTSVFDALRDAVGVSQPPSFEVHCGEGKIFKIWSDGRIEGFEGIGDRRIIINRIPMEMRALLEEARS